jgi:hypothetical protein
MFAVRAKLDFFDGFECISWMLMWKVEIEREIRRGVWTRNGG